MDDAVPKVISRQRRWQLRQLAAGKCQTCGEPIYRGGWCARHYEYNLLRLRRRRYEVKKGIGAPLPSHLKYAWDQWFDGQTWELSAEDFAPNLPSPFRTIVYRAAKKRGLKVRTALDREAGTLRIQKQPPRGEGEKEPK